MRTIQQARDEIEKEYDEPLEDVISGFIVQRQSVAGLARILDVDKRSLGDYCRAHGLVPDPRRVMREHDEATRSRISYAMRQRSRTRMTHRGRSGSWMDWQERTGIPAKTIEQRVKRGWDFNRAITTKPMSKSEAGWHGARSRWNNRSEA